MLRCDALADLSSLLVRAFHPRDCLRCDIVELLWLIVVRMLLFGTKPAVCGAGADALPAPAARLVGRRAVCQRRGGHVCGAGARAAPPGAPDPVCKQLVSSLSIRRDCVMSIMCLIDPWCASAAHVAMLWVLLGSSSMPCGAGCGCEGCGQSAGPHLCSGANGKQAGSPFCMPSCAKGTC